MRNYPHLITILFSLLLLSLACGAGNSPAANNAGNPTGIGNGNLIPSGLATELDNTMDKFLDRFKGAVIPWTDKMGEIAERIFYMLVGLDFAWMCIKALLQDNHISQTMRELLKKVFLYGFGYYLIFNGDTMLGYIFDFFRGSSDAVASSSATTSSAINVGNFFDTSVRVINDLYISLMTETHTLGVISGFMSGVAKLLIIIGILYLIVYISMKIVVAYAEMYMTITASIVLFGFFVSDWTRDISQRAIMHTIAMGFKFFTTLLIARIGLTAVEQWLTVSNGQTVMNMLVMVGVILVFALLLAVLPTAMAAIVSLTSVFSPGDQVARELRSIANQVLIKEPMGQVGAVGVAGSLAVTKAAEAGRPIQMAGGGVGGAVKSAGRLAMGTAKNLVRAYKDAATNVFTGQDREMAARSNFGQRLSYQMYQRKMDSQFRQDQKQSGGGAKGSSNTNTTRAAASDGDEDERA